MIWTTSYLNSLIERAEIEIVKAVPCIIDRYSLITEIGISEYQLPDYIQNIRKVLYKGTRLDPVGFHAIDGYLYTFEGSTFGPFTTPPYDTNVFDTDAIIASTPSGVPRSYFYSKMGENVIRLNPSPNEAIGTYIDLYSTNIANAVIIEYYRMPDGVTYKIPEYIRRRTIKHFVLWKAFLKEGNGQNLKASEYHKLRFDIQLLRFKLIYSRIYSSIIHTRTDVVPFYDRSIPAKPVLPWNYGTIVEDED